MHYIVRLIKYHRRTIGALIFGLAFSLTIAYATPPTSPYTGGETLDPSCAPGDANCTVSIFPDQTGNAGEYLTTDGTTLSWAAVAGGSLIGSTSTVGTETWLGTTIAGLGTLSTVGTVSVGISAGQDATSSDSAVFIGNGTGQAASNAPLSVFIGGNAGNGAAGANSSIFIGWGSGEDGTGAELSTFLGDLSGRFSTNAYQSVFVGYQAGATAPSARFSTFLGNEAGYDANTASNSIFIGNRSGYNDTVNNTGDPDNYSILIGKDTSTGGFSNSIAIGGTAVNTASNQLILGSATKPLNDVMITGVSPIVQFGVAAGNDTTLTTTSNPTKGQLFLGSAHTSVFDEANERLGIGTGTPGYTLHVIGDSVMQTAHAPLFFVANDGTFGLGDYTNAQNGTSILGDDANGGITYSSWGGHAFSGNVGIGAAVSTTAQLAVDDVTLAASGSLAGSVLSATQTWNTTGSPTSVLLNVTNTASGANAKLIDLQVGGVSQFNVSKAGVVTSTGIIESSSQVRGSSFRITLGNSYTWNGGSQIKNSTDGIIALLDAAGTDFNRLQLGGTTSSFPSIKRSGAGLAFRLADDSADAAISAAGATLSGATTIADTVSAGSGSLAGSVLSATQTWNTTGAPTALKLNVTNTASGAAALLMDMQIAGVSYFKVDKIGSLTLSGSVNAYHGVFSGIGRFGSSSSISWSSRSTMYSPSDGVIGIYNNASTDFSRLQFGGTTSSFPSIKRSATGLIVRLADDSADAPLTALSYTAPTVIGGTGTTSSLTLKTTTGVGTTNADMIFQVGNNGATEAMRILNSGFVGIANNAPSVALDVTGDIEYTGTITDVSDERLKENITDFESGLSIVNAIGVKNYNMIASPGKAETGFIAQNVNEFFPQAVSIVDPVHGYMGVSYVSFIPVLTKAVQELDIKVLDIATLQTEQANAFGPFANSFFSEVLASVEGGIAYLKDVVVRTIKIGSPDKRTGITMYDEVTGEPFCLSIANGATKTVSGECGIIEHVEEPPEEEDVPIDTTEEVPVDDGSEDPIGGEGEDEQPPVDEGEDTPPQDLPADEAPVDENPPAETPPAEESTPEDTPPADTPVTP